MTQSEGILKVTVAASFLGKMEATICKFCIKILADIAEDKNWIRASRLPENIKFLSEVIIAFKEHKSSTSEQILIRAHKQLFSDQTRSLLACNPTMSGYFLTAYASLPARYQTPKWTRLLIKMTKLFPLPQGDVPRFRAEELMFAEHKILGKRNPPLDLREFVFNSSWLSRDQMYCFTHRVFYMTDYGANYYDSKVKFLRLFIED